MENKIKINEGRVVDLRDSKIEKLEKDNLEMNTKIVELDIELAKLKYRVTELEVIAQKTNSNLAEILQALGSFSKFGE